MSINETEQLLLKAVLANPADDTVRLVLADYWDEIGNHERAEFCRVQCELASRHSGWGIEHTQLVPIGHGAPTETTAPSFKCVPDCKGCVIKREQDELRRRERELLANRGYGWCDDLCGPDWKLDGRTKEATSVSVRYFRRAGSRDDRHWTDEIKFAFARGFVSSVTCSWSDWLQHADAIRAAQPIERVRLTTEPEFTQPVVSGLLRKRGYRLAGELVWIDHDELNIATDLRDTAVKVLSHRWPGIEFELPPVTRWRNYASQYTGISRDEVMRRMREAANSVTFTVPLNLDLRDAENL